MEYSKQNTSFTQSAFSSIIKVQRIIACIVIVSVISCIGPQKMDEWIGEQYGETTVSNKPKVDYFTLSSPLLTADDKTSSSTKSTKKFLPLIFYWQVDYRISSMLNPKVPMNLFVSAFTSYANSKSLKQKLNGQKLEMRIDKMPTAFSFNDDFRDINLILAQIHWEKIYILPENADMMITYKLSRDNVEIKSGVIDIADPNKMKKKAYFKRMKTATFEYLTQYNENMKSMARSAIDKMLAEL